MKVVPLSNSELTEIEALCKRKICRDRLRPIPDPLILVVKNEMKILVVASIAWYIMTQWLQNFTYCINISYMPFLLAGAATLIIALITMSSQAIRAAMANPVYSLKAE